MIFTTDVGPVLVPAGAPLVDAVAALVASGAEKFEGEGIEGLVERGSKGPRVMMRLKKKEQAAEERLATCSCGARVRAADFFGRCRRCLTSGAD